MATIFGTQYNDNDSFNGVFPDIWWRSKLHGTTFADAIYAREGVDVAYGYAGNDTLYGGAGNDELYGNEGNDFILGGTGNDSMYGSMGDDTFVVMDVGDKVFENVGEGVDTVLAYASYVLDANIENLVLQEASTFSDYGDIPAITFSAPIYGVGNNSNNQIQGNSQANNLRGEGGSDWIYGMGGSDGILGGAGTDVLDGGEGNDWLEGGEDRDSIYGKAGNDRLHGDAGDDWLDGGIGTDTMYGGIGNDSYIVDNISDYVGEAPDAGIDTVYSPFTYSLADSVENLRLTGSNSINGIGNSLNNEIYGNGGDNNGNGGNNNLVGNAGNDTLSGYGWSSFEYDTLTGGTGSDKFILGNSEGSHYTNNGYAIITDFDPYAFFLDWEFDTIQVTGVLNDYTLRQENWVGSATLDTVIYKGSDVVGIVQDMTNVSLTRDFAPVPYSPLG